jgi:hypothetical protein
MPGFALGSPRAKAGAMMQRRDSIQPLKPHADRGSFADSFSLRRWTEALTALLRASSKSRRYYVENFRAVGQTQMAEWDLYCFNIAP